MPLILFCFLSGFEDMTLCNSFQIFSPYFPFHLLSSLEFLQLYNLGAITYSRRYCTRIYHLSSDAEAIAQFDSHQRSRLQLRVIAKRLDNTFHKVHPPSLTQHFFSFLFLFFSNGRELKTKFFY